MRNPYLLVALHELEGIGWKTICKLLGSYPQLEDVMEAGKEELFLLGLKEAQCDTLVTRFNESYVRSVQDKYESNSILPITVEHELYPQRLMQSVQPPWVMYARGNVQKLTCPSIAIVGTRTPTVYGKRIAEELGCDLSRAGVCVVSGMARGIDGAAHIGSLRGPGGTIAVLGCGVDVVYPREHAALYRSVLEHDGLLLSEYPPGTEAHPGQFPLRNRIIAGISLGTVVVEAAMRSGSLITAMQALDESRDVFAVPGPIHSPKSMGTNDLIRRCGAKLLTGAEDLLEEYKHILGWDPEGHRRGRNDAPPATPEEERVLTLLAEGPATIDDLLERLQTNFGHLHAILLSLLLSKRIEQLPGSTYVLI